MSVIEKVGAAIIIVLLFVGFGLYVGLYTEKQKQARMCDALRVELAECGRLQSAANSALERQNAAVLAAKVDTVVINRESQRIVTRYATIRDTVTKSVERDTSAENQLYNIVDVLRRFHGLD
jgi:hypothetical protein